MIRGRNRRNRAGKKWTFWKPRNSLFVLAGFLFGAAFLMSMIAFVNLGLAENLQNTNSQNQDFFNELINSIKIWFCKNFNIFCDVAHITPIIKSEEIELKIIEPNVTVTFIGTVFVGGIPAGNTFVNRHKIIFVGKCEVGNRTCTGWTYRQPINVTFIVSNRPLSKIMETCNHEFFHIASNKTTEEEHEFMEKFGVLSNDYCEIELRNFLRRVNYGN